MRDLCGTSASPMGLQASLAGAEILELYEKFTDLGGVRAKDAGDEQAIKGTGAHLRLSIGDMEAPDMTGADPEAAGKLVCQINETFDAACFQMDEHGGVVAAHIAGGSHCDEWGSVG